MTPILQRRHRAYRKGPDPGFLELEGARERLAGLKNY
jgi:hypothetical protein